MAGHVHALISIFLGFFFFFFPGLSEPLGSCVFFILQISQKLVFFVWSEDALSCEGMVLVQSLTEPSRNHTPCGLCIMGSFDITLFSFFNML